MTHGRTGCVGKPLIVAHRGASRHAPENTLPAFRLAWDLGADAIEGDFHLTRDGHIVCIHDPGTERVSNRDLVVKASTLRELQALDVGAYRGKTYEGTRLPTMAEVFSTVPERKKIYVEIKCGRDIVPVLRKEIEQAGLPQEQIVVISFREDVIRAVKALEGFKAYWLLELEKNRAGRVEPALEAVLEALNHMQADGLSASKNITESFARGIMEQGYEFHVWTVDHLKDAKRFAGWGARSITTNVPGRLKEHLDLA